MISWCACRDLCSTGVSPVSEHLGTGETPVLRIKALEFHSCAFVSIRGFFFFALDGPTHQFNSSLAVEDGRRNGKPKCLDALEVHYELEFGRLHDG